MFKIGDIVKYKRGFALYEIEELWPKSKGEATVASMQIIQKRNGEMSEARNKYFAKTRMLERAPPIDDDNLWE